MSTRLLLSGASGASRCRTIDKVDIFGDGSGVALYRFDGNANEESGNYHGTETNVTYGGGMYERGAVFNGASSKILVNHDLSFNVKNTKTISVNVWMKSTSTQARQQLFYIHSAVDNSSALLSAENYGVGSTAGLTIYQNNASVLVINNTGLSDGVWHLITVTTNNGTTRVYKDGVLIGSVVTAAIVNTSSYTSIGNRNYNGDNWFNGSIDQVRFFNRAITATEVATLYAECAPTSTVDDINPFMDGSLKALYKFDGDATDATGVYNGTATNVTYGTGKFGQCAIVTSGKMIDLGTKLLAPSTSSYSVSCFMKKVSGQRSTLFSRMNTAVAYGDTIFFETNNTFVLQMPNSPTTHGVNQGSTPTTILDDLQFHFICITLDRVNLKGKLYIDGTLFYTYTIIATSYDNNLNVLIGADHNVSRTGTFDQHRFFNKALTPLEVAALYNETTPLEEPMHKLVDPFKDGSGKVLYRLEGNALDESGNYNGTATSVTYGNGVNGRCGVFNGSTSAVTVPQTFISNTSDNTAFSVSLWVKFNVLPDATYHKNIVGSNAGDAGVTRMAFRYVSAGLFSIDIARSWSSTLYYNLAVATNVAISTGVWYNFTFTYNIGRTVSLYKDGVQLASNVPLSSSASIVTISQTLCLGQYINSGSYPNYSLNGSIDLVRIFNKALTQSEITQLYTQGA